MRAGGAPGGCCRGQEELTFFRAGQHKTQQSTRSASSTSSGRAPCSPSSSTTDCASPSVPACRRAPPLSDHRTARRQNCSGRSRSTSRRSGSCRSCSCSSARARQRRSRRTTSLRSARTEHSTCPTGCTGAFGLRARARGERRTRGETRTRADGVTRRYFTEDTVDPIAICAGLVQTALFSDFFYIYFTSELDPTVAESFR